MMLLIFAWRNIWRNRRRSLVTLAAVGLNTAILIATYGLMQGIMDHAVYNATNVVVGEVQIHAPKYLVDRNMYKVVTTPDRIMAALESRGIPAAARSYGYGLVASGTKSAGAMFWGVDPVKEKKVFDLARQMAEGAFLPDQPIKGIVLGRKLARSLMARVGSEIVVVVQAADGSMGNDLYQVVGILKSAGESLDRTTAVMHQADFKTLFVSGGRVHEIALNTRGAVPLTDLAALASRLAPQAEVKTWHQLMPALSDMVVFAEVGIIIFGIIFFLAAGLGVLNTMLMATFERIREFGLLKALGTTPWRILRDVAAEALVLGFVSTLVGIFIGALASYYLMVHGLDTSAWAGTYSVAGVAFDPLWKATITLRTVLLPVAVMWVVCFLASIYPAAIAARQDPVKAMQHV
ncbi:MAG: FtsX-like permease family protein [Pseudomonadota bacterium]